MSIPSATWERPEDRHDRTACALCRSRRFSGMMMSSVWFVASAAVNEEMRSQPPFQSPMMPSQAFDTVPNLDGLFESVQIDR